MLLVPHPTFGKQGQNFGASGLRVSLWRSRATGPGSAFVSSEYGVPDSLLDPTPRLSVRSGGRRDIAAVLVTGQLHEHRQHLAIDRVQGLTELPSVLRW